VNKRGTGAVKTRDPISPPTPFDPKTVSDPPIPNSIQENARVVIKSLLNRVRFPSFQEQLFYPNKPKGPAEAYLCGAGAGAAEGAGACATWAPLVPKSSNYLVSNQRSP